MAAERSFESRNFGTAQKGTLDYGIGDRVRHIKFGEGTVTQIVEGGKKTVTSRRRLLKALQAVFSVF